MEKEHSSKTEFDTVTYKITTNPALEWDIVVGSQQVPEEHQKNGRVIPKHQELLDEDKKKPPHLRAGLIKEEIIAIILYSGPMVKFDKFTSNIFQYLLQFFAPVSSLQYDTQAMAQGRV
jgi:hypothetical protein